MASPAISVFQRALRSVTPHSSALSCVRVPMCGPMGALSLFPLSQPCPVRPARHSAGQFHFHKYTAFDNNGFLTFACLYSGEPDDKNGVNFVRCTGDCCDGYALVCPRGAPSLRPQRRRHLALHMRQHDGRRRSEDTVDYVPQMPGQASADLFSACEAPRNCFALAGC